MSVFHLYEDNRVRTKLEWRYAARVGTARSRKHRIKLVLAIYYLCDGELVYPIVCSKQWTNVCNFPLKHF